jgi:hypothetical protein
VNIDATDELGEHSEAEAGRRIIKKFQQSHHEDMLIDCWLRAPPGDAMAAHRSIRFKSFAFFYEFQARMKAI